MIEEQTEKNNDINAVEDEPELDPMMVEMAMQRFQSEQNFVGGILAGFAATIVGAIIWATITVATGYQIGWMAVGIGFLVGITMRAVGKGIDKQFGIAGAVISLVGCLFGNILSVSYFVAKAKGVGILDVLLTLNPASAFDLLVATFNPIDVLFYGIAVYEGYRLPFRQITQEELVKAVKGPGGMIGQM